MPLFQGRRFIEELLESLERQVDAPEFEVVVADNGSTDDGPGLLRSRVSVLDLRVVDASARPGQTYARNAGAIAARGDHLLFLDQDDVVDEGYIAAMWRALDGHDLVAARVDIHRLNSAWGKPVRRMAQESSLASGPPFPWGYGGTLGVSAAMFGAVGGFDDRLTIAAEDEDLCWRIQSAGGTICFVPDAVLYYRFPATCRRLFRQGLRYGRAQVEVDWIWREAGRRRASWSHALGRAMLEAPRAVLSTARHRRGQFSFLTGRRVGTLLGLLTGRRMEARTATPLR